MLRFSLFQVYIHVFGARKVLQVFQNFHMFFLFIFLYYFGIIIQS